MKKLLLLFLLTYVSTNAQESISGTISSNISADYSQGVWTKSGGNSSKITGSPYLLDKWGNRAKIYTIDERVQSVPFLNYNLQTKNFQTRLLKKEGAITNYVSDSVFVFNSYSISKVLINNREFRKVNNPTTGKKEFMEYVSKAGNIEFYKNYFLTIEEGKLNPLTQQMMSADKFVKKHAYFIKNDDGVKAFKMRKGALLKLFGSHKKAVNKFIKENNLNFKKDSHVKRVVNYYNSL